MDAANILKPALARGELHMIGATTLDEYRKHIEKDTALERRFQAIVVKEPTSKEALAILKGLRKYYEKHHGVSMSDEVLESAVYMSDRYIADRFMPDKAIDVIDEAAARVRVKQGHRPSRHRELLKELKGLNEKMEESVASEDYERAALYKQRISQINDRLETEREAMEAKMPLFSLKTILRMRLRQLRASLPRKFKQVKRNSSETSSSTSASTLSGNRRRLPRYHGRFAVRVAVWRARNARLAALYLWAQPG
jgi:ATP-dependent Clp protease ATP-binding subunit ClpA